MTPARSLAKVAAMGEGTKALYAVQTWDAWARVLARGGADVPALLAATGLRISAKKPPTRLRLGLRHSAPSGQLTLELRVDFAGAARAELELGGAVHRTSAVVPDVAPDATSSVEFGGKFLELRHWHASVPKLMNAVYARSTFLPQLPALDDVARIVALETAVDVNLGAAQRIHYERRQGKDDHLALARMNFDLTYPDGSPFTAADEAKYWALRGPNAGWPPGVAWRRGDAVVVHGTASFGAAAKQIFRR